MLKIDVDKLTNDEKQKLADDLHQAQVFPSRLQGAGSPAHIEAINANLNDLRQMVAVEANNVSQFFGVLGTRQPRMVSTPPPDKPPDTPPPKESGNAADKDPPAA